MAAMSDYGQRGGFQLRPVSCAVGSHPHARADSIQVGDLIVCLDHAYAIAHALEGIGRGESYHQEKRRNLGLQAAVALNRREAEMQDIARRRDPGWIYYLGSGRLIKIGFSEDVKKRMKAYPPDAELHAVHPGTPELERQLHHQFRECLELGREWFRPERVLLDHIGGVIRKFGSPTQFRHSARRARRPGEDVRHAVPRRSA